MSGFFSVGGLVSGLDTQNILDQLRAIERRPVLLMQNKKDGYQKKLSAWNQMSAKLSSLKSAMGNLRSSSDFDLFTTSTEDKDAITLTASSSAVPGEHSVVISTLAQSRKITSKTFSSKTDDLNLSGDFLIDGNIISVSTTDSLLDLADKINNSDAAATASILELGTNEYRLIIAADDEGADSFHILDASTTDVLQNLGFITGAVSVKNSITGGVESDTYSDITTSVGGLLSLSSPQSGTVTIGGQTVAIDLNTDTLANIRDAINTAAPTGVVASIVTTSENDTTVYKLRIEGTTTFSDSNNILQTLGVLEGNTGFAAIAQVATGSQVNTTNGSAAITAANNFSQIFGAGVTSGDTITISGIDHSGASISSTFTITTATTTTIQDLLTAIETAFSNNVTATVNSAGKIVVTDNTAGASQFDVNLIEHNEGGGSLNFGTFSISTTGQNAVSGDIQAGQDASLTVDGIAMTRSSNSITDLLPGVTLNLHQADALITLNISVSRDYDTITKNIQTFISDYNDINSFINEQFAYNQDSKTAGTLMGDATLFSVQNEIRNIISNQISGLPATLRSLGQIGIESDRNGVLSMDQNKFLDEIKDNFDGVIKLFAAVGVSTDSDISYVNHSKDTNAGSYAVNITQAASQASVTGTTNLTTGISGTEVLTITDTSSSQNASITLNSGEDIVDIVSKINHELSQQYSQIRASSGTILASGLAATSATLWSNTDNGTAVSDTFTISGTTKSGVSVSGTYTVASGDTVQDLLSEIQTIFDSTVTATINSSGNIVITDVESGTSQMNITVTANNEGSGTLNLGTMAVSQTGRYKIAVTASNDNGYLKLTHDNYGSSIGFSISQSSNNLGMTDGAFLGQDVAGTINGESATGSGQILTGDSGETSIDGLILRVTLTAAQLAAQGSSQGTFTLTMGAAEQIYNKVTTITDQYDGFVSLREDNIQNTMDDIQDQIDLMEKRVDKKMSNLEMKFLKMEQSLAQMQSLGSYLNSQLAGLGGW